MNAIRHILVARDFSPCSERALGVGLDLAARTGATVHLVHAEVLHDDPYGPPSKPAGALEKLRERLKEGIEQDRDSNTRYDPDSIPIEHAVVRDVAAAPALIRYMEEQNIDLVVLGTHGRRGLRRALLGSVAEEVARLAPCPVLVVREGEGVFAPRTILAAVDFSDGSRAAVWEAARLAELYSARLSVLHIAEQVPVPAFYDVGMAISYAYGSAFSENALSQLKAFTQGALGELGLANVDFHVEMGPPVSKIVKAVEDVDADLVVVGTRGLSGIRRLLLGSVAERVLRLAPVPVLVARSSDTHTEDA